MSIEEQLAEIKHEIRSTNILLGEFAEAFKSFAKTTDLVGNDQEINGHVPPSKPGSIFDVAQPTQGEAVNHQTVSVVDFENVDFTTLDSMGCPYDDSIMTESRKINATGSMKGCYTKKRDKNYDEGQYLLDRRVLINAAKSRTPVATPPTRSHVPDNPVINAPSISNTPPAAPLAPQQVVMPSIADTTVIEEDDFNALCNVFVLKYADKNEGARVVAEKLTACGQPGKTPADMIGPNFQEIRTWVANEIIQYDGQS